MKKILFVCLGNICRSPAAEGVMQALVAQKSLDKEIFCDSAGTAGYHIGEPADARMRKHAKKRNYSLNSRSRQFDARKDFLEFDYILTMDDNNYHNVCAQDEDKKYHHKIHRMVDFCQKKKVSEVPDPYYGGDQGFENVMDILEDACEQLLEHVRKNG